MRKICTGPMQFTPYRPWSGVRRRMGASPMPLLALPAPRERVARPALVTPPVIYLPGPVAPRMRSKTQEAEVELMAYFGGRLGSSMVVHEIDKAILTISKLREIAADIHGMPPS